MIPAERRERLMEELRRKEVLSIWALCEYLGVSHMTVRRDITILEKEGRVQSTTGGVRLLRTQRVEPTYSEKTSVEVRQKAEIAAHAATLITEGQTIYLDAGTTAGRIGAHLASFQDLTVVTNDIMTMVALVELPNISVYQIGGQIDRLNRSSVGGLAERGVRDFRFDLAFVSASAWDPKRGVTSPSEDKVGVKRAVIECADVSVLTSSSSKIGTYGNFFVAPLTDFQYVITDSDIRPGDLEDLREVLSGSATEVYPGV